MSNLLQSCLSGRAFGITFVWQRSLLWEKLYWTNKMLQINKYQESPAVQCNNMPGSERCHGVLKRTTKPGVTQNCGQSHWLIWSNIWGPGGPTWGTFVACVELVNPILGLWINLKKSAAHLMQNQHFKKCEFSHRTTLRPCCATAIRQLSTLVWNEVLARINLFRSPNNQTQGAAFIGKHTLSKAVHRIKFCSLNNGKKRLFIFI